MNSVTYKNDLATLSTVLLANLDEVVFFSKITGFVQSVVQEHKVLGFEVLSNGSTQLMADSGMGMSEIKILDKGQGLSGYVARTKRAYYSNSVKRDPIAANSLREDMVEAELCIPVMFEGSVLGTINIQSIIKNRNFTESDIALVNDILNQLQTPIRNMHLYLIAKNLNRELLARIEAKDKELSNRDTALISKMPDIQTQLIGVSKNFLDIVHSAKKVAIQDFPISLEGPHGVGKKILAKKIHQWSGRKGEIITASCSGLNESELDRELFSSKGLVVQANGGTLVIDDIGNMSHQLQLKLLKILVSGEMTAIDNQSKILLNIRIIATSKVSLKKLVEDGLFKEELYYRINTIAFQIPGLRDRQEDIKVLSEFFLNQGKSDKKVITSRAMDKLLAYHWPGNGHELKNVMERTYILTDGQYIEEFHLPEFAKEIIVEKVEVKPSYQEFTLFDLEKKHIIDTLDHLSGNKTRAAKSLGITVKTLYNKLHSYGLIEAREQ